MSVPAFITTLRNVSIKWKLTLVIMAASTVALLLISGAFVAYEWFTFREAMVDDARTTAKIIGDQSTGILSFPIDKDSDAADLLVALSAKPHIVAACIYKDGRLFAAYPRGISRRLLPAKPEKEGYRFDENHLIYFHSIVLKGETIGTVCLESDLLEMHDRLVRYGGIILLFMLASSGVTFLLSSLLRQIISQPISRLSEAARAVSSEKNYSVRVVKQSDDELGRLIDVFNEMLTQIQVRDAALQHAHDKLDVRVQERTRDLQSEIVERKRAQEALQQQLTRISLLNQITQVIADRQDLSSILHIVLRQLEDHLLVDIGGVLLFDAQSDSLMLAAWRERDLAAKAKMDLPPGGTISFPQTGFSACRDGQTVYVPDTGQGQALLLGKLDLAGIHCVVAVPLMVESKLFGILVVGRMDRNGFSSGESEFLRMLSEHVALAAHQAQLHTQLETAYNELRQTQQAVMQQDRLRALGQMASGIAHDINNALSPVVGFADLLLQFEPGLSQSAKKQLNHIKTAGEDVAHIVARLREFYRQRREKEPLLPVDLNLMAGQVVEMTRPRWRDIPQGRGIMVETVTHLAPDLPDVVGIESELREAMTNLILNAVDAMPQGGTLTISTRLSHQVVSGQGEKAPGHVILQISDTGIGMSEQTLKHCLEPFFSTKGKRGTGLGLAMVYGVMERHEGKIEIESQIGRGTIVRLIFPLRQPSRQDAPAPDEIAVPAPLHILCIDDEPLVRELLKEILEHDGHNVQVADGGLTGLDAFRLASERGRNFDVVITDLGMPYVDGREVARTLKSESPKTPVVMLTGWGAFMKTDGTVPLEVDGILSKPPRSNELRSILGRLTRK
ncbi:MAG TPA: ATP-binding protein [Verrucomicrobiae bacterium]|nr:ATP-binding protein [Verrucomicrobiae bacterium]